MKIIANALGKRFDTHWVLKNFDLELAEKASLAITGANGSGKSTLLQLLAGYLSPSTGKVNYQLSGKFLSQEIAIDQMSLSAPYVELVEELTLDEFLRFHSHFRKPLISVEDMIKSASLQAAANKQISGFSSGMKQRVRLILQFYFRSAAIFLDEPTSNLDDEGINWYVQEISKIATTKTIVIASNVPREYDFVDEQVRL